MNIAEARHNRNVSQKEIAGALGIPISTYCLYETGQRSTPADVAQNIADYLHVRIDDIFLPIKFTPSELREAPDDD